MATKRIKKPATIFLREWREFFGLKSAELADKMEIGRDQMGRYETGDRKLTAEQLGDVAEALGIEPSELFIKPPPKGNPRPVHIVANEKIKPALTGYRDGLLKGDKK